MRGPCVCARLEFLAVVLMAVGVASAQVPSRNVNMVSGTGWPGGDPFLQRQNEPSVAVSTRNPLHLVAGANDYRTVDLPGLTEDKMTGDAWLGVFTSTDGGATWKSTLLPGYPQEANPTPPLHGFDAGADPVVRAGPHGLFYYSGIAFDRDNPVLEARARKRGHTATAGVEGSTSAVFVARYIDNNNKENGDPIAYLGTKIVAKNTDPNPDPNPDPIFLDKPWLAVDMPRLGGGTCTITQTLDGKTVTQTVPAGNVYVAYSQFTGKVSDGTTRGKLMFSRSTNCGATWSTPVAISGSYRINQGATIALDPRTGTVYVAWRRFAWPLAPSTAQEKDAILIARSLDRGKTFTAAEVVSEFQPFDQPTGSFMYQFRTSAYPAAGVDRLGRVLVVYSARGVQQPNGDARILLRWARYPSRLRALFGSDEDDGTETLKKTDSRPTWTAPSPVDPDLTRRGHQIMPSMLVTGLRVQVAWVDLQQDHTWGEYARDPVTGQWLETRVASEERAQHPENVFKTYINDADVATRRHSADVWIAQANPGDRLAFTVRRASDYKSGTRYDGDRERIEQLQFNPPNLPLFKQGTASFWGDYIDLGAQPLELRGPKRWRHSLQPAASHVVFTDNRDVRAPVEGGWSQYTPPLSPALNPSGTFQPGTAPPPCDPARPERAGMRNQNVYAARITQGLFVSAPGNAKPLGGIKRAFVVSAANDTFQSKTFRMTIPAQPSGGSASFKQFKLLTQLEVTIGPRSSVSRTVYVSSTDPRAQVKVEVNETSGGVIVPPASGGLQGTTVINPDTTNPDLMNPDLMNPDMAGADVTTAEVYSPDLMNPDLMNPDLMNPDLMNPDLMNPDLMNPDLMNPDLMNPDLMNSGDVNVSLLNPDLMNPDLMNDDFLNGTMTDTVWTLTNNGNTTAAYDIRLVLRSAEVPEGIKTQLLLYKSYTTPVSRDCQLTQETQNVLIASIPNPRFDEIDDSLVSDPADGSLEHATLWLAPGESARITLRVVDPDKTDTVTFDPVSEVVVAVAPQPVDTESVEAGETTPEVTTTSSIVFLARPTATPIGGYITPPVQVLVQNDDGTPVAGATVTLSLASNAGGATLHGGTATTGADGVATFSTLWLDRLGNGYRLQATAGGRTSNDGGSFDVVPLVVTTTSDAGPGSLRAAIENANRNVGYADTISFAIPGGSVHRIGVASPLPAAADPVTIDATTQPGYAGAPLVELDGQSLPDGTGPPGTGIPGLIITAGASAVRGFAIFSFPGSGVVLSGGSGNVVEGNYLGLTAAGVPVHIAHGEGNGEDGINVLNSSDNRIGGAAAALRNVISANTGNGVFLDGTWRTVVVGNYIGTAPDGTTDFGSFKSGVRVRAGGSNVIGGSNGGEGNVISGHDRHGVSIEDSAGNTVCGDLIGTTAAGDRAMGNDGVGIVVARSTDDVIGGLVPGCRNVIAGGIWGLNANRLTIAGNFIGTNAAGTAALVDSRPGIRLEGCTDSVIGGAATTARNVVGGSQRQGIVLDGSSGARVAGNFVGTDATGTLPIPNGSLGDFAIEAVNGAHDNTIGGTAAEGNLIAFNVGGGVRVGGVTDERNAILSNRLHSNGGLGIDLGFDGVTANDLGDGDTGPNDLLNYPILSSAVSDATQTTASGSVDIGVAGATVNIQFFHNQTCDPTGHGEGQTPVGQTTVTTGASGTATFVASLPGGLNPGFITATTILPPANTTSEFSACRSVTSGGTLSFSVEPAATPIGGYVTPPVEVLVQDESGAALPGATVALSFASNPGGATLHGGTATTNSSGIATFSELWLDRLGGGYRLRATVGAYPAEDSAAFEVTPLVVTTVAGFGAGSLRAAIENANRNAGYADAISFAIPGAGPHTIAPSSPLPVIADALMIDGTTQPAYAGTPMIDLSGQLAGSAQGLVITGVGSTVRGLAINGFQNEGIWLTGGSGNVIQGNFIGTEATGSLARANRDGILITASPDNLIGGTSPADRNVISGNLSMGVRIEQSSSTGNQVVGNFIGTDATGTVALGNGQSGVLIVGAPGNTVGGAASGAGNVISGNGMTGVTLAGTSANTVLGNRIGTDASGTAAIPNQGFGVSLGQSSSDTIGGEAVGAGNLVSGNGGGGVAVGPMTVGAIVAGNRIGTNADGTSAIGNAGEGIYVTGPDTSVMMIKANVVSGNARTGIDIVSGAHHSTLIGNRVGTNAAGSAAIPNGSPSSGVRVSGDAHTNTIGGAGAGEGNLISGNHVGLTLTTTHDNTVQGNRIGTNADGTAAVPNAASGIFLDSVAGGTIGGAVAGQGNLVSGNGECGISVWLTGLSGALIAGNRIGTNAEGTAAVGNTLTGICLRGAATSGNTISGNILSGNGRHGLEILGGPHDNTIVSNKIGTNVTGTGPLGNIQAGVTLSNPGANVIGALTPALGNTIAFNGTSGVAYFEGTAPNFFGANRIHSNGWLGIGLTGDTPTANDPVDSDSGPNDLLNFPVLTSAVGSTAGTTVEGTLNSLPAETFTIQVFSSGACDPSGNGEGEVFLGSTTVVTSSPGGVGTFSLSLPTNLTGQVITATASTSLPMAEETSEFSACRQVAPSVPPTMIVDTFGPGGSFDDETNIVAADGRFATPPTGPGPSTSIRAATKFAVPDGTSYSLSSITLPISFQGPNPGTLRVRLTDDVAGVPGTTTLETLSENENRWPAFQNPFTATTTLNSVSSPRLSGGSSYWLVTELTVFPTDWADYRWFQNGLVSPTLSVLQQQTEGESLPSGGWVGAISSVQPLALRVEGLPVP